MPTGSTSADHPSRPVPPPPPPASEPSLPEPSAELLAHFHEESLRRRLLRKARWLMVPSRRREDVVHTTMMDAWNKRHTWPGTVVELDRWLFRALRNDILDAKKKDGKAPLLREVEDDDESTPTAGDDHGDADPPGVTLPDATLEARDGLRAAEDYVESRPKLRVSFQWLLQQQQGKSYEDIAAEAGVRVKVVENALHRLREELRQAVHVFVWLVGLGAVVWTILYVLHGRVNDQAKPPAPPPTVLPQPPPSPPPPAPVAPTLGDPMSNAPTPAGVTGAGAKPHVGPN
jgi:RNA polymerase sigma factor (sigma-70 family)